MKVNVKANESSIIIIYDDHIFVSQTINVSNVEPLNRERNKTLQSYNQL